MPAPGTERADAMRLYRFIDAATLRASAHVDRPSPWPDFSGDAGPDVERWRAWLAQVWADDSMTEAIEVASPVLAQRVRAVCDGQLDEPRQVRRVVVSVARYLLRMTSRATPFGLFAGVAPARSGPRSAVRWKSRHRVVARVDAAWLAGVITRLETCIELRRRLLVVRNSLCFLRGDRLVVPWQQQAGGSGERDPAEISVRHTDAVAAVMHAADTPTLVADLAGKLSAKYPETPRTVIEGMLSELVACRILLTSLRPPMTATDPLSHVLEQLDAVDAEAIPQAAPLVRELRIVHAELARYSRIRSLRDRWRVRASVAGRMKGLFDGGQQPFGVDLRLDCEVTLPAAVPREAEGAAAALARLSPYPRGDPSWRDYHARFLERYGTGALVPVIELVNPDIGLGFPAGYRDSLLDASVQPMSKRDERLLALAQQAVLDGSGEIILTDQTIAELAGNQPAEVDVPPHTELCLQIHAATRDALDAGEFQLMVVSAARAAGITAGRFLDLFDPADRNRMTQAYAALPTADPDALPIQVSCPPLYPRTETVARTPEILPSLLPVAEFPHSTSRVRLTLEDLAVSANDHRLSLVSLPNGRPVEPLLFSAVELRNRTQPVVRFLCEISRSRTVVLLPFSWGVGSRLPFLPRVRYGRSILAPARWNLPASDLPDSDTTWKHWDSAFTTCRSRLRVPDMVFLGEGDQRIRLDLAEQAHRYLLRSHLDRHGHATLIEAPDSSAYGWLGGRAHEIVVPLAAARPSSRPSRQHRSTPYMIGREHGHLPGFSPWLYVKLYTHPDRQPTILISHLPGLLSAWDEPPEWWYVSYRDPDPHLRLRIRLPGRDAYGQAVQRVGAWAAGLRRLGLASQIKIDSYYPETGRYGTGAAMVAAEAVFAADSAAAIAQMTYTVTGVPHPHAVAAASFVDLATTFSGSVRDGMQWLIANVRTDRSAPVPKVVRDEAVRLADPRDDWAALRELPGGEALARTWSARRTALAAYHTCLIDGGQPTPDSVLPSLLHMHHVRTFGIDRDAERGCHRLARAAALSWRAHNGNQQ